MSGKLKLAISGKARTGKNTAAEMIVKHMNIPMTQCKIVALADPMKHIVKTMFPEASNECLFGPSELRSTIIAEKYKNKDGNTLTHRQALIDLGAFGRQYNNNIWLNCLVEDANQSKDKIVYICSDVRFVNEFEFLKSAGFYMIRIKRPSYTKIDDVSETQQDAILDADFNLVIDNDGSLEDLSNCIADMVAKL